MTPKEVLEKWIDCFNASDVRESPRYMRTMP